MAREKPLVTFEEGGDAAIVNYDVPMPTSYGMRSIVEFDFPDDIFRSHTTDRPAHTVRDDVADLPLDDIEDRVRTAIDHGFIDPAVFDVNVDALASPVVQPGTVNPGTVDPMNPRVNMQRAGVADDDAAKVSAALADLSKSSDALQALSKQLSLRTDGGLTAMASAVTNPDNMPSNAGAWSPYRPLLGVDPSVVARRIQQGQFLYARPTLNGDLLPAFHPEPEKPKPQFALVEKYRLSNFLGDYGAGRTLKTFSLFPGEETTIALRTFKHDTASRESAANVFEASSRSAASEFERELETETTTHETVTEHSFWKAGGEAELDLGIFSIGGGGGGGGQSHAVHEHTARAVANASEKHAARSSARREVDVQTERRETSTSSSTEVVERTIENVNQSRTLNLVFRQMNQQYLTLFHLVDVRVAYTNGFPGTYREAPLYELDSLIDEVVTDDDQETVRDAILAEIRNVYNYRGDLVEDFAREVTRGDYSYWAVDGSLTSRYVDEATGLEREVSGVVLSGTLNTIRTDGVIVEALLGRGEALDRYETQTASESVREHDLENDRLALGLDIVREGDAERADIYRAVFGDTTDQLRELSD